MEIKNVTNNNTGTNDRNYDLATADIIKQNAKVEQKEVVERTLKLTRDRDRNDRDVTFSPVVKRVKRVSNKRGGLDLSRVRNMSDLYDFEDM